MYPFGLPEVKAAMRRKGYLIFSDPHNLGYDLNLVGIRTGDTTSNEFNDYITVFYKVPGNWAFFLFPATTDPGTFFRVHPINVRGTAILKPGQYRGAYKIGRHRHYKALRQQRPMTVYRDSNKDQVLDTLGSREDHGIHYINLHRANLNRIDNVVGRWSAGCQVIQDSNHFDFLLNLCENARKSYGNSFTYTLLEEADF